MTHVVKTADGGTFEPVLGDKARMLNEHTRHEIDEAIGRFPTGRHRSAVLSALRFTQEQNNGFLTPELMDGVAVHRKWLLDYCRRINGPESDEHLRALRNLAHAYSEGGQLPEARALFEEALALSKKLKGPEGEYTLQMMNALGNCLMRSRKLDEALVLSKAAAEGIAKIHGEMSFAAGQAYFNGAGGCSKCHSPSGDLKGVGAKYNPVVLQGRMINPRVVTGGRRGAPPPRAAPIQVKVTLAPGRVISGTLVSVDDFFVTLIDTAGDRRTIERPIGSDFPKVEINDPLEAHRQLMLKYTDEAMHNLVAYLVTLK